MPDAENKYLLTDILATFDRFFNTLKRPADCSDLHWNNEIFCLAKSIAYYYSLSTYVPMPELIQKIESHLIDRNHFKESANSPKFRFKLSESEKSSK